MIEQDMYGASNEEQDVPNQQNITLVPGVNTHDLVVNGQRIRVVDPAYVFRLETRILANERLLNELRADMVKLQDHNRGKTREIRSLQSQLERKIDRT